MIDTDTLRMQYLGVLQLLGNAMAHVSSNDELHDSAQTAYDDAMKLIPRLRVRRVLCRYDLEID